MGANYFTKMSQTIGVIKQRKIKMGKLKNTKPDWLQKDMTKREELTMICSCGKNGYYDQVNYCINNSTTVEDLSNGCKV